MLKDIRQFEVNKSNQSLHTLNIITRSNQLGIDSQCLSYIIDAMASVSAPVEDDFAAQKLALIRLYFYLPGTLWVTPTVVDECARIRNVERAKFHQSFINTLFGERQVNNANTVRSRVNFLCAYHSDQDDCSILAEAEDIGLNALLSFDKDFVSRLAQKSHVELIQPADYWKHLNIPSGTKPDKIPHFTNPLSSENWWKW